MSLIGKSCTIRTFPDKPGKCPRVAYKLLSLGTRGLDATPFPTHSPSRINGATVPEPHRPGDLLPMNSLRKADGPEGHRSAAVLISFPTLVSPSEDSESQEPRGEFIGDPRGTGELLLERAPRLGLASSEWGGVGAAAPLGGVSASRGQASPCACVFVN